MPARQAEGAVVPIVLEMVPVTVLGSTGGHGLRDASYLQAQNEVIKPYSPNVAAK